MTGRSGWFRKHRDGFRSVLPLRCEELEDRRVLAIFTVTNALDAGAGSLRQAIIDSNAAAGADIINFAPAVQGATINLTTQMDPASVTGLLITDDLTIDASAGARVTVAGNDTFRIFKIDDGTATDKVVEFNNLQIQGGNANNEVWTSNFATRRGGGIDNREAFTLRNSLITENSGRRGGGLSSAGTGDSTRRGSLTVIDSAISGNTALNDDACPVAYCDDDPGTPAPAPNRSGGRGAGIGVYNSSPVNVSNSIIEGNSAASIGAGIDVSLGVTMTMTDSTIRSNMTAEAGAAAYISQFGSATYPTIVTMDNVTITDNTAGIPADSNVIMSIGQRASVTIQDSAIENNLGIPLRPIFEASSLTVTDSTISGNTAVGSFFSDAAVSAGQGATATLIRTEVTNNTGLSGARAISSTLISVLRIEDSLISGNEYGGITADVYGGATVGSDVQIVDSEISNNGNGPVTSLGGIYARTITDASYDPVGTRLELMRTTVSGNTVGSGNGGGIHAVNFLGISIEDSTIDGNQSIPDPYGGGAYAGGGIWLSNSSATITRSTVSNNLVNGNVGGGIGFLNAVKNPRSLNISQSTISGNSATSDGGGIWMRSEAFYDVTTGFYQGSTSMIDIQGSTVTGNVSDSDNDGYGVGGGLFASAYTLLGYPQYSATQSVTLSNSIVSQNADGMNTASDIYDNGVAPSGRGTPYITGTYSFIGSNAGSGFVAGNPGPGGNKVGTAAAPLNAMLDALADNGGLTKTHLPTASSPVIDMGDPATMGGSDQRGFNRVFNGRVDIGSVEVQPPGINLDFDNNSQYDCGDMDLLEAAIDGGVYNAAFDVNQDLALNSQDVFDWLIDAGALRFGAGRRFLPGDANLNGSVDGSDFGIWNTNKFTAATNWCQGDFNQSDGVDGSDFGIWNSNKFMTSDASRPDIGGSGPFTASHSRIADIPIPRPVLTPLEGAGTERVPQTAPAAMHFVTGQAPLVAAPQAGDSFDKAAVRGAEVAAVPALPRSGVGSQDLIRHATMARSTAIDRVFAELPGDDWMLRS